MIIYVKVVYQANFYNHDPRSGDIPVFQKEFCVKDYEHFGNDPMRRSDDRFVCDSIEINRYDNEDHFEFVAKTGKVARHFSFTKVIHVEIDEEVPEIG